MVGNTVVKNVAAGILVAVIGCGGADDEARVTNPGPDDPAVQVRTPPAYSLSTPFMTPPLMQPPTLPVKDTEIPPDTKVVGVQVGEEYRAYLVSALSDMKAHVVADRIDGIPITMTYCDQTDCVRAFEGQADGDLLPVQTGGFSEGEMLLRIDGTIYAQSAEDIPLKSKDVQRMTWKEWSELHPDTRVFLGNMTEKFSRKP